MNKRLNDILIFAAIIGIAAPIYLYQAGTIGIELTIAIVAAFFGFTFYLDKKRKAVFAEIVTVNDTCAHCGKLLGNDSHVVKGGKGILTSAYDGKRMHKSCLRQLKKNLIRGGR